MSDGIRFHKLEGCGNDYVFLDLGLGADALDATVVGDLEDLAREVSDRHTGVGSDGLIVLDPGDDAAPVRMRMWNADGSRGRLCLNGLREAALLARTLRPALGEEFRVVTDAGIRAARVEGTAPEATVTVEAGIPDFARAAIPAEGDGPELWDERFAFGEQELPGYGVSVGNPHLVLWMTSPEAVRRAPLAAIAEPIQQGDRFPEGVNVHLAADDAAGGFLTRPFERGSGATRACGTGAVAVYAVARRLGRAGAEAAIHMPGGSVRLRETDEGLVLSGLARLVFRGTWFPRD